MKTTLLKNWVVGGVVSCATMLSGVAHAGLIAGACNITDVSITGIAQYNSTNQGATLGATLPVSINSSACAGSYAGQDKPYPTTNLGYYGDGLLNGAAQSQGKNFPGGEVLFPNGAFVTQSELLDLKNDGTKNDPGWIFVGKIEGFNGGFSGTTSIGGTNFNFNGIFGVNSSSGLTGSWWLTPPPNIASILETQLNRSGYFDHFALVFTGAKGFSVYDFKASSLGLPVNPDAPVYSFTGSFDLDNTLFNASGNPSAVSHVALWVRDPSITTTVPEPGALSLIGLALLGAAAARRQQQGKRRND